MRYPHIYEADGSRRALLCSQCDEEIWAGEGYYCIEGETVCQYCLPDFARRYFARHLQVAGEKAWL